jgi:hypothetical protein
MFLMMVSRSLLAVEQIHMEMHKRPIIDALYQRDNGSCDRYGADIANI